MRVVGWILSPHRHYQEDWRDITPEDVAEIIRWWENEEERREYDDES